MRRTEPSSTRAARPRIGREIAEGQGVGEGECTAHRRPKLHRMSRRSACRACSPTLDLCARLGTRAARQDVFTGTSQVEPLGRVFGGQVLAQSLVAAQRTIGDRASRPLAARRTSCGPGDLDVPITFTVDRIHDGRSFATRRTQAYQNGVPILSMIASFQTPDDGLEHQVAMPEGLPEPESLPSDARAARRQSTTRRAVVGERPPLRHAPRAVAGLLRRRGRPRRRTRPSGSGRPGRPARRRRPAPRRPALRERLLDPRADLPPPRRAAGDARAQDREPRPRDVVAPLRPAPTSGCSTCRSRRAPSGGRGLALGRISTTATGALLASVAQEGMVRVPRALIRRRRLSRVVGTAAGSST